MNFSDPELVLAGTCWGEARGGGMAAMGDVASVIINRVRGKWAPDVIGVCLARLQFSCWNMNDPNRAHILEVAEVDSDPSWLVARGVARAALNAALTDRTRGADSYYAVSIAPPFWAAPPAQHTATLWLHSFWRVRQPAHAPVISGHSPAAAAAAAAAASGASGAPGLAPGLNAPRPARLSINPELP